MLVVEADLDLTRLVSFHNDAIEQGFDEQQPTGECRLKENEYYIPAPESCSVSSATAAWIAAAMVAIKAAFAAGLRSKVVGLTPVPGRSYRRARYPIRFDRGGGSLHWGNWYRCRRLLHRPRLLRLRTHRRVAWRLGLARLSSHVEAP